MRQYGVNASRNVEMVRNSAAEMDSLPSCFMHCHFTLDRPLLHGLNAVERDPPVDDWVNATEEEDGAVDDHQKFRWFDSCSAGTCWPPCNQPARTFPPWERSRICFASCSLVRIVTGQPPSPLTFALDLSSHLNIIHR